jgi:tRNA dimethylallyltransferase
MQTLFIVGPTSTGKTDLCVSLVPSLLSLPGVSGVDILSADSKHVYIGEDIVTGKDTSALLTQCDQYPDRVSLFGIDMVKPDEAWSVSHFLKLATEVADHAAAQHRLLIIVGGTALYLHSLLNPPATAVVPRNESLRVEIESLSTSELQTRLQTLDAQKYAQMNHSDQLNPRRLVRAIEVATWHAQHSEASVSVVQPTFSFEPSFRKTSCLYSI